MVRTNLRVGILTVLAVVLGTFGSVGGVSAASPTLRIEPATQTVASGAAFSVKVVMNTDVPTGGVQVSVTFDHTKVQITSVARGGPFSSAPIVVPTNLSSSIAAANSSGKLATVAAAFLPPATVPAGDAEVLVIAFKAIACGVSDLGLPVGPVDGQPLDGRENTYGSSLTVTATGGKVTVDCGAAATATPRPAAATPAPSPAGATPKPTPKPTAKPTSDPTASPSGAVEGVTGTAPPTDTLTGPTATQNDTRPFMLALASLIALVAALIVGVLHVTGARPTRRRF